MKPPMSVYGGAVCGGLVLSQTVCVESGGWTAHLSTKLSSMMIVFLSVRLALLDGNDGRCSDVLGAW